MAINHNLLKAVVFLFLCAPVAAWAQTGADAEPALKVLSFKINREYYPMLDGKPSAMSADNGELPMTDAEIAARNNVSTTSTTTRRNNAANTSVLTSEKRSRGRLRSNIQILDNAESVNLTVRNTGTKAIKAIVWDFAFPRMEEGKLLLRYETSHQAEIKPGAKKSLKHPLPAGASRCKVISATATLDEKGRVVESLCGRGFNDPSKLPEKQEPVTIKRIEYADGSSWQKP